MTWTLAADASEFITLVELKDQLNIPLADTRTDVELALYQGAAQEQVEAAVGPVLHRTVTETVRARYGRAVLRIEPVLSVESLVTSVGAVPTTYTFDPGPGLLRDVIAGGDLTVTYTAGRASVPDSIRLAALIIAQHLWETQRGSAPQPLQDETDLVQVPGMAYAVPNRAANLLQPYLLTPAVG